MYKLPPCGCDECAFIDTTRQWNSICSCRHKVTEIGCEVNVADFIHKPSQLKKAGVDLKPRKMKPQVQMNPVAPQYWQARVVEYGAKKYARGNFRLPVEGEAPHEKASEYIRAAIGHLLEAAENIELYIAGMETSPLALDEESGLPHLAHAMCSVAFAITAGVDGGIFPKDPKK